MTTPATADLNIFRESITAETPETVAERARVRDFLADALEQGLMTPACDSWLSGHSPAFSRELGRHGWIGMTWPACYGGRDASTMTRFAVMEELLAAGAPVAAHWFSDRQIGPGLLRHGTEAQRQFFLPALARGDVFFCIGMSEPESGSDLGSIRTRATRTDTGWSITGAKIWTSHADKSQFMLALVRTGVPGQKTTDALTQVIIDMSAPGITVRPIEMLGGRTHFCEVTFDDVHVEDVMVLGAVGNGWRQVLGELGFERSGPERFLSTFPMVDGLTGIGANPARDADVGSLVARLSVLRAMSARISHHLDGPVAPGVAAAVVKDLGTTLENDSIQIARRWLPTLTDAARRVQLSEHLHHAQTHAPGFTLRGGTNEIMRGIIAGALGVS
ncbi:acyl-CoA dehydrogenase family protein [Mycolicibacterium stellerae]|uniref:acyl-CoA dehydrogenase family protein n=1 Tax=Mycolicibacterium stellerae TaxID=2358193 RepID=UPI000F0B8B79|nr:acyl-CoA dehydrogenase family protein [Mycolicibacterium stellerae]